jgi:hypothetical protein
MRDCRVQYAAISHIIFILWVGEIVSYKGEDHQADHYQVSLYRDFKRKAMLCPSACHRVGMGWLGGWDGGPFSARHSRQHSVEVITVVFLSGFPR